jgi:bacterioferritin
MAAGISSFSAKAEFLHHAIKEQAHANLLAERISQLGGKPNMLPEGFMDRSCPEGVEGRSLRQMITEDLLAKRIVIDSYRAMVASVATEDPTTCKVFERILAKEEAHVADRARLLKILGPESQSHSSGP